MSETQVQEERHTPAPSTLRRAARIAYLVLALVLMASILVQVFLAGAGVLSDPGFLAHHAAFMEWFQAIPVFLLIAALLGKMTRTAKFLPVFTWVGFFLQYQFIGLRPSLAAGLHTVNALLIFWLTLRMVDQGRRAGAQTRGGAKVEGGPDQALP